MKLPFTTNEFLELFGQYNAAVWPAQVLLTAMASQSLGFCSGPPHIGPG